MELCDARSNRASDTLFPNRVLGLGLNGKVDDLRKNGGGVLLGECVGRRGGRELQGGGLPFQPIRIQKNLLKFSWPIRIQKKMNSTNEVLAPTGRPLGGDR